MAERIFEKTVNAYFEYGVLGVTIVLLMIVSSVLLLNILRDKKADKQLSDALQKTTDNQEKFVLMYQESQKQHKEIVGILNETLEIERANTKECYIGVANKMDKLYSHQERLVDLIKANR
jgi:signal transduction histidine kinase